MKNLLLLFSLVFFSGSNFAQISGSNDTPQEAIKFNQILLNNYSQEELNHLYTNSREKYNSISYYFLSSYIIEITDSTNVNLPLFDLENFNISKYEVRRELENSVVLDFGKYGVKLTLLPYKELQYLTPIQRERIEYLENQ